MGDSKFRLKIRILTLTMSLTFFLSSFVAADVVLQCFDSVINDLNLTPVQLKPRNPGLVWIRTKDVAGLDPAKITQSCWGNIYLKGSIMSGDFNDLEDMFQLREKMGQGLALTLNSPGGDVYEAMKIGRLLPERNVMTMVDDFCASACVLVFAGGARKVAVSGKLAIHRIQFAHHELAATLKQAEYRKAYDKGMDAVRDYLKEMGIRPELADEMMRYSSDEGHVLTQDEMKFYGLDQENPYLYEQRKSRWIARCGEEWWELKQTLEKTVDEKCPYESFMKDIGNVGRALDKEKYNSCKYSILGPLYKMCGIDIEKK